MAKKKTKVNSQTFRLISRYIENMKTDFRFPPSAPVPKELWLNEYRKVSYGKEKD